jgi:hypothetical protein
MEWMYKNELHAKIKIVHYKEHLILFNEKCLL